MRLSAYTLSVFLMLCPAFVGATTWGSTQVQDPIDPGAKCDVSEPQSYGSYIYQWPEKYDQVFWPLTERNGIWVCRKTGFVAFIGDFDGLSEAEVARIGLFLQGDTAKPSSDAPLSELLATLEQVYALREKDAHFRSMMLRVLAYHHEYGLDAPERAADYRRQALSLMREELTDAALQPERQLEYLFVSAAYERWFGDTPASDALVAQLEALIAAQAEGPAANYVEYLSELKTQLVLIVPGGKLAPSERDD